MRTTLLDLLACPQCGADLRSVNSGGVGEIECGMLTCGGCAGEYPIVRGIPRFVPATNYADNFGFQWNRFRETQLDSRSGLPISTNRFVDQTGWRPDELRDQLVLDVGCGAGRFAEVALSFGARVIALDYSSAIEACRANHGRSDRIEFIQGDIYALPLKRRVFPFVYCLGVLQHTPDVERAVKSLPPLVAPGGSLVVDLYLRTLSARLHPRFALRPLTTRMEPERLFSLVQRLVPTLLAVSRTMGRIPAVGRFVRRLVPVADYAGVYPLSERQRREWAILDTFDWLGPKYDQPQTAEVLQRWLTEAGLENIDVFRSHHLTGRGRVPAQ